MMQKDAIRKFVLQNAIRYGGSANPSSIIGKILGNFPELRKDPKKAMGEVCEIAEEVNRLTLEKQREELEETAPEMLEKKEAKRKGIFDVLRIKEGDTVKTAFPPGPEKYPHIGHAKACIFNYLIAKKYNGRFVLRFEDTNPNLVKNEFYDIMIDNFKWLNIEWDELMYASDNMKLFYDFAVKTIERGNSYICNCDNERIKESRAKGVECGCRKRTTEENLKLWNELPEKKEGEGILRLKIDLKHKNSTMRDPTIFRIIETPHARHGTKYRVWPNYDFQNAIMDGYYGITHRVRSKEFEMRSELQRYIQKILGLKVTSTFEFARFNIEGVESSGRIIREKVQKGDLVGWDDPSLTTLVALRRRGFLPEAIKEFLLKTGMTKNESTLTWDDLIMHNKRLLDKGCNRIFFVDDPVRVTIKDAPNKEIGLKKHPEFPERGTRKMKIDSDFFLSLKDVEKMTDGALYRLMDCLNFVYDKGKYIFDSEQLEEYKKRGKGIIHFLPANMKHDEVSVMMPDHSVVNGLCENIDEIKEGGIVQFERFGFVRLDSKKEKRFWFTHK